MNYHTVETVDHIPMPRLKRMEMVMMRIITFPKTRLFVFSETSEPVKWIIKRLKYINVDIPRLIMVIVFSNFDFRGFRTRRNPKTVKFKTKTGIT